MKPNKIIEIYGNDRIIQEIGIIPCIKSLGEGKIIREISLNTIIDEVRRRMSPEEILVTFASDINENTSESFILSKEE